MISLTPGLFFNAETAEILAENAENNSMIVFFRVFRVEKKLKTIFESKVCNSHKFKEPGKSEGCSQILWGHL